MRTLVIVFQEGTEPKRQRDAILRVAPGQVLDVHQVSRDVNDSDLARLAYAYVSDDADLPSLTRQIEQLDSVESVSAAARRQLPRRRGEQHPSSGE